MDPLELFDSAVVTVEMKLPGGIERISQTITMPGRVSESLRPLPRDRELPWCPGAALEAARQLHERRELLEHITRQLAAAFLDAALKAVAGKDSRYGYSPEEWNKLMGQMKNEK